jgi:selenide,water dikinase
MTKTVAAPGDVLVLSKPLGTGATTTALKNDRADPPDIEQAIEWMALLNRGAAGLARKHRVRAATDVTGFSLLGHAHEMASGSQVALNIHLGSVPFLRNAKHYVATGNIPGGSADNKLFYEKFVEFDDDVDPVEELLLFDAQTSGGLLIAVPEGSVSELISEAERENLAVWPVGNVEQGSGISVRSARFPIKPSIDSSDLDLWHTDRD